MRPSDRRRGSPDLPDYKESRISTTSTSTGRTPPAPAPLHQPTGTGSPPLQIRRDSWRPPPCWTAQSRIPVDEEPMGFRKPVIYLYPPSSLPDVTAELLLTSTWSFSAVYPPPQSSIPSGERQTAQSLTWALAAEPSSMLVDKTSGPEVSYLYWEAT